MKLTYHPPVAPEGPVATNYPDGYWVAETDDGDVKGVGRTQESATSILVENLRRENIEQHEVVKVLRSRARKRVDSGR